MANNVDKVNGIAIADIQTINGITDDNLQALNSEEFTGTPPDAHTLISTHTASSSATLDITSGIDSTYDAYEFRFTNMHPATDHVDFQFQINAAGASGFNETITSTYFEAYLREDNGNSALTYRDNDQAQGTAYQDLSRDTSNDSDSGANGTLTLYAPSSTTYVKHFTVTTADMQHQDSYAAYARQTMVAGYINTTSAIDEISFKFDSGNIDAGEIKMYGIATS